MATEKVYAFPGMKSQSEGSFAATLKKVQFLLNGVNVKKGKTRQYFDTLWSTLLCSSSGSGMRRVVLVGKNEVLQQWLRSFPPLASSVKKTTNPKKKKGKKKKAMNGQTHKFKLPDYLVLTRYDPAESEEDDEYGIDCAIMGGDLVLLLPGCDYRASSVIQRGNGDGDINGDVIVVGLGSAPCFGGKAVVKLFNDSEDCRIATAKEGSRLCVVNLRIEVRATSYEGCLVAEEGSAIRLLNCDIGPQDKEDLPHDGMFGGCFEVGGVETSDLIDVDHGSTLLAEGCIIGPSTQSGIILRGKCTATLRACLLTGAGRGDKIQRIDRIKGVSPINIEGRCPAIAISFAANIRLEEVSLVSNYGYPLQWANADEEEGKVDQDILDENTSPEEHADYIMNQRTLVSELRDCFLACHGFDLRTPEGRASMRETGIEIRERILSQIHIKRTPGYVETHLCKQSNNALSRYLTTEEEEFTGSLTVQSWFDSKSNMGKMVDRNGELIYEDGDSPEVCKDKCEWQRIRDPPKISGCELSFKPKEVSATASLFKSMVKDKELQSRLTSICAWHDRNCRDLYFKEDSQQLDLEDRVKAYAVLNDEAMENLRERLARKCLEKRLQICKEMNALTTGSIDSEEARRIAWGALAQTGRRHPVNLTALNTVVVLHSDVEISISPDRAHVLVACLECDDMENSNREYEDVCDCEYMNEVQAVIQVLGELHSSIADALINLLGNIWASDHGRSNAAEELANLASRQSNLRRTTIEAISASLIEQSDFSAFSRGSLIGCLQNLRAKECSAIVRKAFKRGLIDEMMCGGYIDYLLAVSLPVDTKDRIVRNEVKNPSFLQLKDEDPNEIERQLKSISHYKAQQILEHNKKMGDFGGDASQKKQSCSFCGTKPRTIYACSRCNAVAYCGDKCQTADWKGHKRVCKSRKNSLDSDCNGGRVNDKEP